ncbi:MAG: penicillin-binding transpeptidase domain-containing protein [Alphaproteobacteria bacterium]
MKKYLILLVFLTLLSCCRTKTEEIDLSSYFAGLNGTAVFYNANTGQSKIYNKALSYKQSSPCSTFKIMSSYIGLSEHKISMQDSSAQMEPQNLLESLMEPGHHLPQAFQASCVWYYRRLINEVGEKRTKHYLQKFNYGNMDTSDWKGLLNSNTNIPELRGFWLNPP